MWVYKTLYVQKLFMNHQGDRLLRIEAENMPPVQAAAPEPVQGEVVLAAERAAITYRNISLTNNMTGEQLLYAGHVALNDTDGVKGTDDHVQSFSLGQAEWTDCTLRLTARRTAGPRGFLIHFGVKDEENKLSWEIGGWQNQDTVLVSQISGRGSCLTQSLFTVESEVDYELELHIAGRTITASIDGVPVNAAEERVPVIEPLYYTASVEDASGDLIVKAVNVKETPLPARIELKELSGARGEVEIFEMSGFALEDANDLDSPVKVSPATHVLALKDNVLEYEFPKHSVTVFRVKQA